MNPDDLKPAPPPLRLVQQFLNTRSLMRDLEMLDSRHSFCEWYQRATGAAPDWAVEDGDLDHLKALREALRAGLMRRSFALPEAGEEAGERITQLVAPDAVTIRFSSSAEPHIAARWTGMRGFEGVLVKAVMEAHYQGSWERLKVCASAECQWAFYDNSKNRAAAWCDMSLCGARAKMRAYRLRRHAPGDG